MFLLGSIAELSSHHWIAPYIFRIPTTVSAIMPQTTAAAPPKVGMIPCTARPPRPLSMTRPEDLAQVSVFLPLRPTSLPSRSL